MYGKGQEYDAFGCAVDIYDNILLSGALLGDLRLKYWTINCKYDTSYNAWNSSM